MKTVISSLLALLALACGGGYPEPKEASTAAEAAIRSAQEVGAERDPRATLHLKFAKDELEKSKELIAKDDNHRAELVLLCARADAELAIMMAKAANQKAEADKALAEVAQMRRKLGK